MRDYRAGIAEVEASLTDTLSLAAQQAWARPRRRLRRAAARPAELARRLAALPDLVAAPDIVLVAQRTGRPVREIAATHFAIEAMFRLGGLIGAAREIAVKRLFRPPRARPGRSTAIAAAHRGLTAEVVAQGGAGPGGVAAWSRRAAPRWSASGPRSRPSRPRG